VAEAAPFQEPGNGRKWLLFGVAGAILLTFAYYLYGVLSDVRGIAVPAPPQTVIDMLPPPPPPPPPPPEPETKPPEPTEAPTPTPVATPSPAPDQPAPMQIDGPAQAGADAFGLTSGKGGGMGAPGATGTCIGSNCGAPKGGISDAFYNRYLSGALQERIQDNNKVNRLTFTADFAIWIGAGGRVTKADLMRSSGDAKRDALLASILQSVGGLDAPPASLRFPQKITVRGRRSL
jgi:hypothetical protein